MSRNEILADNLLKLVREHKGHCNSPDCDIKTFPFLSLFEDLIGREATPEEKANFF